MINIFVVYFMILVDEEVTYCKRQQAAKVFKYGKSINYTWGLLQDYSIRCIYFLHSFVQKIVLFLVAQFFAHLGF